MVSPSPHTSTTHNAPTEVGVNDSWTGPVFSIICGRITGQVVRTLLHEGGALTIGHNAVIEGAELGWCDDPPRLTDLSAVAAILAAELERAQETGK
ncbi:hypothetical protein IUQ79_20835 [Mycobacteroides abscessus subsp. bolletii]|uniref:hypothetical protein n=1 Tax=Mycobacteroides abscessus TaxID=36809 RepID=UPI0019CF544E|nr:hypothetical protein [Mycobacteroides abscessus]MBN7304346.1 hypothetical protein [Mycobacteroides abscessus subsp. bolletii]